MQWGDKWGGHEAGPSVELVHRTCGHVMHPQYHCDQCGEALQPHDIAGRPASVDAPASVTTVADPKAETPRPARARTSVRRQPTPR